MGINDIASFPFPTPPPLLATRLACHMLYILGALKTISRHRLQLVRESRERERITQQQRQQQQQQQSGSSSSSSTSSPSSDNILCPSADTKFLVHGREYIDVTSLAITEVGRAMSLLPIHPRLSKILLIAANQHGLLPVALALTSALTVNEMMIKPEILRWTNEREEGQGGKDGEGEDEGEDDADNEESEDEKAKDEGMNDDDDDSGDGNARRGPSETELKRRAEKKEKERLLKEKKKAEYKVCNKINISYHPPVYYVLSMYYYHCHIRLLQLTHPHCYYLHINRSMKK